MMVQGTKLVLNDAADNAMGAAARVNSVSAIMILASVLLLVGCRDPADQSEQVATDNADNSAAQLIEAGASAELNHLIKRYADSQAAERERTELRRESESNQWESRSPCIVDITPTISRMNRVHDHCIEHYTVQLIESEEKT